MWGCIGLLLLQLQHLVGSGEPLPLGPLRRPRGRLHALVTQVAALWAPSNVDDAMKTEIRKVRVLQDSVEGAVLRLLGKQRHPCLRGPRGLPIQQNHFVTIFSANGIMMTSGEWPWSPCAKGEEFFINSIFDEIALYQLPLQIEVLLGKCVRCQMLWIVLAGHFDENGSRALRAAYISSYCGRGFLANGVRTQERTPRFASLMYRCGAVLVTLQKARLPSGTPRNLSLQVKRP